MGGKLHRWLCVRTRLLSSLTRLRYEGIQSAPYCFFVLNIVFPSEQRYARVSGSGRHCNQHPGLFMVITAVILPGGILSAVPYTTTYIQLNLMLICQSLAQEGQRLQHSRTQPRIKTTMPYSMPRYLFVCSLSHTSCVVAILSDRLAESLRQQPNQHLRLLQRPP